MLIKRESIAKIEQIGGKSLLAKMVDLFCEHAPKNLQSCKDACEESNLIQVADSAHAIKSSAGNFGADDLFAKAAEIEKLARQENPKAMDGLPELERLLDETAAELQSIANEDE